MNTRQQTKLMKHVTSTVIYNQQSVTKLYNILLYTLLLCVAKK